MWSSESALSILYRAASSSEGDNPPSSPPADKVKRAIEEMTPEEIARIMETPIMLSPTMREKIKHYSHEQYEQFFEKLKQNTAARLLDLIAYFSSTSFLHWDDYIVTYLTLKNMRDDILKLMEKLPPEKKGIITEKLRQHDAIYTMGEDHHRSFIESVQLLLAGDKSVEQSVRLANWKYEKSSSIMMDIYKSVYVHMSESSTVG